ncbi:hypothetical protein JXA40_12435 [bacterium]|nr:hypothetical protein [candidate division CSSED10-310 bacterium]
MKRIFPKIQMLSMAVGLLLIPCLIAHCGHKTNLHPPAPRRVATIPKLLADVECETIVLSWEPVFFDNKGTLLESPADYLVLRRRGDWIEIRTSETPAPTPSPNTLILFDETAVEPGESTPIARPTVHPPEFAFKLIGYLPGTQDSPVGKEPANYKMIFRDPGLPGIEFETAEKYKPPKGFPPEKTGADLDLLPGYSYYYKVQAVGPGRLTSDPSQALEIKYFDIPGPPRDLTAEPAPDSVILAWNPPETTCTGSQLGRIGGYYIERTLKDTPDIFDTIGTVSVSDERIYRDGSFRKDAVYLYRVRAFTLEGKLAGLPADPVEISTTDTFSPDPPAVLKTAYSSRGVHLLWEPSPSGDVAGYRIYRSTGTDDPFRPLSADELIRDSGYIDDSVVQDQLYRYYVTAVDDSTARNESLPSPSVKLVIP